jgi:DivIVA domain-containing protein
MGIAHDVAGWEFIILAVISAARVGGKLVTARRAGARPVAIAAEGLGLYSTVLFLVSGLLVLHYAHRTWLSWIVVAVGTAGLLLLAVLGIMSRRRVGGIIPPPSAAGSADLSNNILLNAGPADISAPEEAIVLDASTLDLIEKITNAKFSTVRLSGGYDEEEVDRFLDKLVAVLREGGRLNEAELLNARFTVTRLRPGYVKQDVHSLLQEVARAALC